MARTRTGCTPTHARAPSWWPTAWAGWPTGERRAARTEEATGRADALERQLAGLQSERSDAAARLASAVDALAADVAFPGVRVAKRPDAVEVVFDDGLFALGDRLTGGGAAMLAALGKRLTGRNVSTTVVGHAVAVPGGPSGGGSVVALARALVAARELAESSGAPLTAFTLTAADQAANPFPDPARTRTVTLVVAPK